MNIGYIPKLSLDGVKNPFQVGMTGQVSKTQPALDASAPSSMPGTFAQTLQTLNDAVTAPDAMMQQAITTGTVDVHDLMIANSKAELLVSITTQVATKVVQAYDKIMQIQI